MNRADHKKAEVLGAGLSCLVVLFALLATIPSNALGAQDHAFVSRIAESGSAAGQLSLQPAKVGEKPELAGSSVAVNDETGDLYVADSHNQRISEFNADGQFIRAFGADVGGIGVDVCTVTCAAGTPGSEPGQLNDPTMIAIDNSAGPSSGDVYVVDAGGRISKFTDSGILITSWGDGGQLVETPVVATGTGTLAAGSSEITELLPGSGEFHPGLEISGEGIPKHALQIQSPPGTLRLNKAVTLTKSTVALSGAYPFDRETETENGGTIGGIAVDHSGNLWIAAPPEDLFELSEAGSLIKASPILNTAGVVGIALNRSGFLFFGFTEKILRVNTAGGIGESSILSGTSGKPLNPTGIGIGSATEDIYVDIAGSSVADVSAQCKPVSRGCLPTQEFGAGHLSGAAGLGVSPDGTIYVADAESSQVVVFKPSVEATIEAATQVEAKGADLSGKVNPEGTPTTTCVFQYGSSTSYGGNLPCLDEAGQPIGSPSSPLEGKAPIAVHASLAGLKAGLKYHYRLRVANVASEELPSEDGEFETKVLPEIEAETAVSVTASSATLKAEIDPQGLSVETCQIEWGSTTAYGNSLPCSPSSLPAASSALPVEGSLEGLSPTTTYHWRVLAKNANGTEISLDNTFVYLPGPPAAEISQDCQNEALREVNGSTALPDCRAYEMVTPPAKNGAIVGQIIAAYQYALSQSGSRILAPVIQCFGHAASCNVIRQQLGSTYEFSRSAAGWLTNPLAPPASEFTGNSLVLENGDSSTQLFAAGVRSPSAVAGREWFYVSHSDDTFAPLGPIAETTGSVSHQLFEKVGDADLSHVVYTVDGTVWPSLGVTTSNGLYEYAGAAEHPFLVDVTGPKGSSSLISTCQVTLGNTVMGNLSADGHTVYFTAQPCAGGTGENAGKAILADTIYARIDGEEAETASQKGARTVDISAPACGAGPSPEEVACRNAPPASAALIGTSANGTRAYFLSTARLTDDASEDSHAGDAAGHGGQACFQTVGKGGCNLYLYSDPQEEPEPQGRHLVDASAGDSSGQGPQVQGVMAISSSGSRAYFVAKGLLAGANREGNEPIEGADNLYVYDADEDRTRFVAALPGLSGEQGSESEQWLAPLKHANVTPDGRYLLFLSEGALAGGGTRAGRSQQVYRYDAVSETLNRISIGQRGYGDDGNDAHADASIVPAARAYEFAVTSGRPPLDPSMSADGARVFFESPAALTPGALDEVPINHIETLGHPHGLLASNIYEWEEDGVGGCDEAEGCVYLVSDGADIAEGPSGKAVALIGTDATGDNVFFTTGDSLVPADTDTELDVYDARVGGGFPPPRQVKTCESSDTCHEQGTRETPFPSPATPNNDGPSEGPLTPQQPPCRKGFVKKGSKCFRRHRPNHGKNKKSHKRTGSNRGGEK